MTLAHLGKEKEAEQKAKITTYSDKNREKQRSDFFFFFCEWSETNSVFEAAVLR